MSLFTAIALSIATGVAVYLIVGNCWHHVLQPLPPPDPATFPVAGDVFGSNTEGVVQEITGVRNGWVTMNSTIAPGAKGPPMHVHRGFAETFAPTQGVLHVELADHIVRLEPGQSLHVPAGVAHRPFNPTGTEVVIIGEGPAMPQNFAASLVQLYRVMEEQGSNPVTMLLQASVMDPIADVRLAAVPVPLQRVLSFVLAPAARLLGYRNYYPEYALHGSARRRHGQSGVARPTVLRGSACAPDMKLRH
ncbi:MAG: cupin domain-containing protein [Gemmatimonadota bacterium]